MQARFPPFLFEDLLNLLGFMFRSWWDHGSPWRLARREKKRCLHFTHAVSPFSLWVSIYLSRINTINAVLRWDRSWDFPGHDACCASVACVEGLIQTYRRHRICSQRKSLEWSEFLFLLCLKWCTWSRCESSHRTMLLLCDQDSRRKPSIAIGRRFRGAHFSMFELFRPFSQRRNWTQLGLDLDCFPLDSSNVENVWNTRRFLTQAFKAAYEAHVAERAKEGIPPLALDASQVESSQKDDFENKFSPCFFPHGFPCMLLMLLIFLDVFGADSN